MGTARSGGVGVRGPSRNPKKKQSETPTQCLCPDGFIEKYIEMLTSVLCIFPSPQDFPPSPLQIIQMIRS